MLMEYTLFGGPPAHVINAVKASLNSVLGSYAPVIHKIARDRVTKLFGSHQDWEPIKVHDIVLMVVGASSARVFHSTAASENDEWLALSTGYVMAVFDSIRALKAWQPYLRPFVFRFLPERKAIQDQWMRARKFVAESLSTRQRNGGKNLEDPPSCLDFLCSSKNVGLSEDVDKQLLYQMTLVAVGTVTTHATIVQCLYDLAMYPEYIPVLREEIEAAEVDTNGLLTKTGLTSMKKMDSFIKESQRLSHPDLTTFQRAATGHLTLPDGTFVPKGTKLEIATAAIYADGSIYPEPEKFDGMRFYRMRQEPGEEGKHQFTSVILKNYDLRLPPNASRPANTEVEVILPTIIAALGHTANAAQLWSVIPYAVASVVTVIVAFASDHFQVRGIIMLVTMPIAIVGYAVIANVDSPSVKYGMTFLMATGLYSSVPPVLGWLANNSAGHYKRATAAALQLAIANCGGFVTVFVYPSPQAPQFHKGHTIILSLLVGGWFMILGNVLYCHKVNKDKARGHYDEYIGCGDDRDPSFRLVL
ncbi:hypothetical protein SCUCBS95973_003015 [Sporothrix curviconia]|uniref:Cytochrome P450 n=1 Tax=Sporothrix curviconia TaxID=1260050 RepID=A0ABP0BBX2_9PEZI